MLWKSTLEIHVRGGIAIIIFLQKSISYSTYMQPKDFFKNSKPGMNLKKIYPKNPDINFLYVKMPKNAFEIFNQTSFEHIGFEVKSF